MKKRNMLVHLRMSTWANIKSTQHNFEGLLYVIAIAIFWRLPVKFNEKHIVTSQISIYNMMDIATVFINSNFVLYYYHIVIHYFRIPMNVINTVTIRPQFYKLYFQELWTFVKYLSCLQLRIQLPICHHGVWTSWESWKTYIFVSKTQRVNFCSWCPYTLVDCIEIHQHHVK